MQELTRYTKALLLLQLRSAMAAGKQGEGSELRPEILLADAGFSAKEAAELLGKTPAAVAKAISRARVTRVRAAREAEDDDRE